MQSFYTSTNYAEAYNWINTSVKVLGEIWEVLIQATRFRNDYLSLAGYFAVAVWGVDTTISVMKGEPVDACCHVFILLGERY